MSFRAINLFFPVVLAIHNVEEYAGFDEFARSYQCSPIEKIMTRPVMRGALLMLTAGAAVNSAATFKADRGMPCVLSRVGTFSLLFNAVGHCLLCFVRRRSAPGTVSSILVILPYSALAVAAMLTPRKKRRSFLVRYAVLGAISLPVITISSLIVSYALLKAVRAIRAAL